MVVLSLKAGSPEEIPPPVHFKIHYMYDAIPRTGHGFKHPHFDPYEIDAVTSYDNWEYKYYGQWWDMGSLPVNILIFLSPLLLYLHLENQNVMLGYTLASSNT